ncbi:uncharacterized protein LACBIDRAFT_329110 [Laccaria bicolor S238N-H82]|uniref:Predicted protein n=1 Tax=Laccaria bicolor (strain S238N-H82 / ATCC MYA-4686) TaxID=486041 RepID=B0DH41_LACBS|nr:uncharacterized protein LACBIDRAFT_329110 [Laccaria bicolor S238N-H82]EDR05947.1 predicted protein [Laccaria bicolor S238N-H82]|eukprot:XP_001883235.1 predicted protein [Laccaria bicolor S238N-H82]
MHAALRRKSDEVQSRRRDLRINEKINKRYIDRGQKIRYWIAYCYCPRDEMKHQTKVNRVEQKRRGEGRDQRKINAQRVMDHYHALTSLKTDPIRRTASYPCHCLCILNTSHLRPFVGLDDSEFPQALQRATPWRFSCNSGRNIVRSHLADMRLHPEQPPSFTRNTELQLLELLYSFQPNISEAGFSVTSRPLSSRVRHLMPWCCCQIRDDQLSLLRLPATQQPQTSRPPGSIDPAIATAFDHLPQGAHLPVIDRTADGPYGPFILADCCFNNLDAGFDEDPCPSPNATILITYLHFLYFSSLRTVALSISSYDEFGRIQEHQDHSRLKQRCRQKFLQETVTKTLVVKGSVILTDLSDEVVKGEAAVAHGTFSDVRKGTWNDPIERRPRSVAIKVLRQVMVQNVREKLIKRLKQRLLLGIVMSSQCVAAVWDSASFTARWHGIVLLAQVASAIAYPHTIRPTIVHGDSKGVRPLQKGNIPIDEHVYAIITDFGLSKVIEELPATGYTSGCQVPLHIRNITRLHARGFATPESTSLTRKMMGCEEESQSLGKHCSSCDALELNRAISLC